MKKSLCYFWHLFCCQFAKCLPSTWSVWYTLHWAFRILYLWK